MLERTLVAQLHLLVIARNAEVGLLKHGCKLLNKSGARLINKGCEFAELVVVDLDHVGLKNSVRGKVLQQGIALLKGSLVAL